MLLHGVRSMSARAANGGTHSPESTNDLQSHNLSNRAAAVSVVLNQPRIAAQLRRKFCERGRRG